MLFVRALAPAAITTGVATKPQRRAAKPSAGSTLLVRWVEGPSIAVQGCDKGGEEGSVRGMLLVDMAHGTSGGSFTSLGGRHPWPRKTGGGGQDQAKLLSDGLWLSSLCHKEVANER